MKQPDKWRETIDPFSIKYKDFKIIDILGYPYAGNDVFYVTVSYKDRIINGYLKIQTKSYSDLENEVEIINSISLDNKPQILEYGISDFKYLLTKEIIGEKLSTILIDNKSLSASCMQEYGIQLAKIHNICGDFKKVKDRKFFDVPNEEYFIELNMQDVYKYLIDNKPNQINYCFCHGDFHYGNLLWKNNLICGILDFELAGIGNKEFDIAWALIRRPNQKIMGRKSEINAFLKGYSKISSCNCEYVKYYMILIYSYFYKTGENDKNYQKFVKKWLKDILKKRYR